MATQYYKFNSAAQAKAASESDWETKILKRAKKPEDVTTALWGYIVNPNTGDAYGVVTDDLMAFIVARFTAQQVSALQSVLLPASDPGVVATLAAIAAAQNSPPG